MEAIPPLRAGVDFVVIVALSVLNGWLYHLVSLGQPGSVPLFLGSGLAVAALFVAVVQSNGFYVYPAKGRRLARLALLWTLVFLFLAAIAFLLKISDEFSRGSVLAFYVTGMGALILLRGAVDTMLAGALASGTLLGRRIAVAGESAELNEGGILRALEACGCKIEKLALLPVPSAECDADAQWAAFADQFVANVRQSWPEEVVVVPGATPPGLAAKLTDSLRKLPIPVSLVPDRATRALLAGRSASIGSIRVVELQRAPLSELERLGKRALDILLAASGLFFLAPLMILVAIVIQLDNPGPILFLQTRMGFNGYKFRICKYRTMKVLDDGPIVVQARRNDPRVTRIGALLRKTSIDELPQLFNVLKGDMSLVGPRPHAVAHDNEYAQLIADYALRYHVKPGITGWAQVNGLRGETPTFDLMKRRVDHDLWYIRHWSFSLDLLILMKTVVSQLQMRNVY
jgi:Undecaprenyl-phosphate glucose phosphotransferase